MTTLTLLTLSPLKMFTFQPTLDGQLYTGNVIWGLFGQRPYLEIVSLTGTRILTTPIVSSPPPVNTSSVVWQELLGNVLVTTDTPHNVPIGWVINFTMTGVTPDSYNGIWPMLSTGPDTLTFAQTSDPGGDATIQGTVARNINLVQGYFQSTLVYRESTNFIEVSP